MFKNVVSTTRMASMSDYTFNNNNKGKNKLAIDGIDGTGVLTPKSPFSLGIEAPV